MWPGLYFQAAESNLTFLTIIYQLLAYTVTYFQYSDLKQRHLYSCVYIYIYIYIYLYIWCTRCTNYRRISIFEYRFKLSIVVYTLPYIFPNLNSPYFSTIQQFGRQFYRVSYGCETTYNVYLYLDRKGYALRSNSRFENQQPLLCQGFISSALKMLTRGPNISAEKREEKF